MPVVAVRFPWRRYHATPWGHYVNEGRVEIPPSPWRILRALYAVWQQRRPALPEDDVHGLLTQLAAPPVYLLPPYTIGHTRHYVPDSQHRSGKISSDKLVDAFALLGGDATIHVQWHATLTAGEEKALQELTRSLPYLGRADSLCAADTVPELPPPSDRRAMAVPLDLVADHVAGNLPPQTTQAQLLAPALPLRVDTLLARPIDVRAGKLVYPPGTRKVAYAVPCPASSEPVAGNRTAPRRRPAAGQSTPVTVVRLSVGGSVRPPLTQVVPLADALRAACVKRLTHQRGLLAASMLAGRGADGEPLAANHQHAHYLPLDLDGDRRIDDVLIWAPGGLAPDELAAIDWQVTHRPIGVPEGMPGPKNLQLRVAAFGGADVLPQGLTGPATRWKTVTPFAPPRHRHRAHGDLDGYIQAEIRRELRTRGFGQPARIHTGLSGDWPLFTRHRWTRSHRTAALPAYGAEIEFAEPVTGPIILGALSHFGLGLFHNGRTATGT